MLTLVIGGARSGKSRYAEGLLQERRDVTYVATGYPVGGDSDWRLRVTLHQERRPSSWTSVETLNLPALLGTAGGTVGGPLLIDCLTLWLTRTMDSHDCWTDDGWERGEVALRADVRRLLEALATTDRDVVLVTNEVGQGVVPADPGTRRFVDEMGALNSSVAEISDDVVWCIAGRTVRL